jgi:Ran GTPase-activating protein (RanGAP) involved in mRNA processing and transport
MDLSVIASGLAMNNSVKSIAYNGDKPHLLLGINTENHTLEVLDLGRPSMYHRQSEDLAVALNKFRALKSLNLSRREITPEVLSAIFKVVLMPPFKLENLILCRIDCGMNNEALSTLGECIAASKSLRRLDLSREEWAGIGDITTSSADWASFFRQLRETALLKLESINLQNNLSIDDSVLQDLMDLFRSTTNLKTVKLGGCGISSNGANRLLDMLHQTSIQEIDEVPSKCYQYVPRPQDFPVVL